MIKKKKPHFEEKKALKTLFHNKKHHDEKKAQKTLLFFKNTCWEDCADKSSPSNLNKDHILTLCTPSKRNEIQGVK